MIAGSRSESQSCEPRQQFSFLNCARYGIENGRGGRHIGMCKAVNEAVERHYSDLEELVRATREKVSVHNFRGMYARIAYFWYAPPPVADITYMAQIQGHLFVLEPRVEPGTASEEVEQIRHNYASHANYADYKIADTDGNIDGRQGGTLRAAWSDGA